MAEARNGGAVDVYEREFVDRRHEEMVETVTAAYLVDEPVSRDFVADHFAADGAQTVVDQALRLDQLVMLVDDPVKRVDNMSRAWGLEARVPFLDHELVELAARVPPELKLAQGGKGILKDIARPIIGSDVVDRPKGYFPVPAVSRLDGQVLSHVIDVLRSPEAKARGLIEPGYVDALLEHPELRFAGQGDRLWHLGVLEMWL